MLYVLHVKYDTCIQTRCIQHEEWRTLIFYRSTEHAFKMFLLMLYRFLYRFEKFGCLMLIDQPIMFEPINNTSRYNFMWCKQEQYFTIHTTCTALSLLWFHALKYSLEKITVERSVKGVRGNLEAASTTSARGRFDTSKDTENGIDLIMQAMGLDNILIFSAKDTITQQNHLT